MHKIKKILAIILAVSMFFAIVPTGVVFAVETGDCGDNLTWSLNNSGTLTISGTGDMWNYSSYSTPWSSLRNEVNEIIIDENVTSIGEAAFWCCLSLKNVTIGKNVKSIGNNAFEGCSRLTRVTMFEGVTDIGEYAFRDCYSLIMITIPDSVTHIGKYAFYGCESLENLTIGGKNLVSIDESVFCYCKNLKYVFILDGVINIGFGAFTGCEKMEELTIGKTVVAIDDCAFSGCSNIASVIIPNSVKSIGDYAFSLCNNLTDVYYSGSEDEWNAITIGAENNCLTNATIHYNYNYYTYDFETDEEPNVQCTLSFDITMYDESFNTIDSITYDTDNYTYSADSFVLYGYIINKDALSANAENVEITITLPEGFSFENSVFSYTSGSAESESSHTYEKIYYSNSFSDTVYLNSPSIGDHSVNIHVSGDNVEDADYTYTIPINQYIFEVDKYRADYLLFTEAFDSNPSENIYFDVSSNPAAILVESAKEQGFDSMANLWDIINSAEGLIDDPSSLINLTFEDVDMYEAILWDIFECSTNNSNVSSTINSAIKDSGKNLIDQIMSDMKYVYKLEESNTNLKDMTQKQRDAFMEGLSEKLEKQFPKMSKLSDLSSTIGKIMDASDNIETVCNTAVTYCSMYALQDSVKQVMKEMYQTCPADSAALKAALLKCVTVMNTNEAGLLASIIAVAATAAGQNVAEAAIGEIWGSLKNEIFLMHPAAYAFLIAFKGGKFLSNVMFNTDEITEAYFKIEATVEVQNIAKTAYNSIKSDYRKLRTNDEAKIYNSAVDIMFNAMDKGCDVSIAFVDAVADSLAGNISALLGDTTAEERKTKIEETQRSTYLVHEEILRNWVSQLEEDNPTKYEVYKHLIDESKERINKKYDIECPVDVYVYNAKGKLVASVVGDEVYAADDANLTIYKDGDAKHLYLHDDTYSITYVGYASGSMDITITEYDNQGNTSRKVYFDDLPLRDGMEYSSSAGGSVSQYTIDSEDGTIYADYDSETDGDDPHLIEELEIILTSDEPESESTTETSFQSTVSSWAKEEIEEAYAEDLIPQILVGEDLTKSVNRAEFAAIAVALYENLSGSSAQETQNPFWDISDNACKSEILKAYNLNITNGTSDYEYSPDTLISREQVATMLTRAYKKSEFSGWSLENDSNYPLNYMGVEKFADDSEISDYAKESVYFLVRWGVITGVGNNMFAPKGSVTLGESYGYATREQALAIALRTVKYLTE